MKLRRVLGFIALLLLVALLVACSPIQAGRITQKVYEPERVYYTMQCSFYNSKGMCQSYYNQRHVDDEDWRFDIDDGEDTGYVYVTASDFESHAVGDWVDYTDNK